jgi:hypothetical protein
MDVCLEMMEKMLEMQSFGIPLSSSVLYQPKDFNTDQYPLSYSRLHRFAQCHRQTATLSLHLTHYLEVV